MRFPLRVTALAALVAACALSATTAQAQGGLLERAKRKAKEKLEQEVDKKTADTPAPTATPAASSGSGASAKPAGNAAASQEDEAAPAASERPGEGAWANYDFKPGDRILYADDFTKDEVGDFPKRMEFRSGALEIVDWKGSRFLRATANSKFELVLPEVLPQRFTIEFDYLLPGSQEVWISTEHENKRVEFAGNGATEAYNALVPGAIHANAPGTSGAPDRIRRARILGDGKYIKVYVDDKRTLNVPNADLGRANKILFNTDGNADKPTLFGNFRVAAGGKKLYDALTESGRVATQGIYFDTGSDRIRPESTPTLKEIAAMLKDHADLKLAIEGHTDNVGAAAANQALSEKRAAAVKAILVSSFGVEEARVSSKGLGATKPSTSNDTAEGRQQNRRVELVKL